MESNNKNLTEKLTQTKKRDSQITKKQTTLEEIKTKTALDCAPQILRPGCSFEVFCKQHFSTEA